MLQYLVARFDSVLVCDTTDYVKEGIVSRVENAVVPHPDIAHYDVN